MMVSLQVLIAVLSVLLGFVVEIIGRPGLSGEDITAVPFIGKLIQDSPDGPGNIPLFGAPLQSGKLIRDLLAGISVQVHKKDQPYGQGFLFIDDKVPVLVLVIT